MNEQTRREGQHIGNYRLVRLLGRGGFAEVFLAEHIHLNTQAAVKLLNTHLANEGIEGFRNEARMIAGLVHPYIVRVLDFGVENAVPYLVMDYAPNGTLRQRHQKGLRLPLEQVVSYVQQIAGALQYAHEQHVIHRDIKPENMLLGRNNEVLLSDFGIALVAHSSHYQQTQNIAGTLAYMAPEQIQAHPRPASDQYSLGIVVYEWLAGQRPFQGTMTEIAIKHATAAPPPLRQFAPDLSPPVEQVVQTALQKDPRSRFPTILAFAQALEGVYKQSSAPFPGSSALSGSGEMPAHRALPLSSHQSQIPAPAGSGQYPGALPVSNPNYPSYLAPPPPAYPPAQSSGYPASQTPAYPPVQSSAYPASQAPAYPPVQSSGYPASQTPAYPPVQSSAPYPLARVSGDFSQAGGPPPPPPAYLLYAHPQASYPPSTEQPRPYPQSRGLARRTLVAALAGGAVALAGSGLAYYAFANLNQKPSVASGPPISRGTRAASSDVPGATATDPATAPTTTTTGPQMTFSDHSKIVWAVSWSPNGKYIASASDDGTSHIWNASTGQRLFSYRSGIQPAQSNDGAYSVAWMPDSTGLAIGFSDGTAQTVSLKNYKQTGSYDSGTAGDLRGILYAVAISPDGRYLALGGFFSDDIQIFEIASQRRVRALVGHTDGVWAISWSHNGKYIASGSADATARVWDWQTGKARLVYNEQDDTVRAVSWSPDDARIVSGGLNGPVSIWTADTGQTVLKYGNSDDFETLAVEWSHNGKYVASSGGSDAKTHVWNAQNGQLLHTFPSFAINGLSWSSDDSRLAVASNKAVEVWQVPR